MHAKWKGGRHSRMLQPASAESVRGDFAAGTVTLRGQRYTLRRGGGGWFIRESYLTGEPRERRVDFTLGNRRIQHYLTRLDDGRIVVLPPSWDVQRREVVPQPGDRGPRGERRRPGSRSGTRTATAAT